MEFQLNNGRDSAGNQLLPLSYWLQIHSPQMALEQPQVPVVRPWFPAADTHTSYGLGWRLGMYRGTYNLYSYFCNSLCSSKLNATTIAAETRP